MITGDQLKILFPRCGDPAAWAAAISRAWQRYGFDTPNAQAGYLAIIGNETGGLTAVRRENMAYTAERAAEVFKRARANPDDPKSGPSSACIDRCARGSMAFANWIYRDGYGPGNGSEASGDGWKFRGGGACQLTGRANYKACGDALGIDLIANPDLVCNDPDTSAAAAAWFMAVYRPAILPALRLDGEQHFLDAARLVGATDTQATLRRLDYRKRALAILSAAPAPAPGAPVPAPSPGTVAAPATAGAAPPAPRSGSWLDGIVALLRSIFVRRA